MKQFLVFFAVAAFASAHPYYHLVHAPAPLNPDGTVADTPEVAAAKVAHFAELAKAGGAVPHHSGIWYGAAPLNPDGTVADTPAVAAAKAVHFAALAKAGGYVPYVHSPYYWHGAAPLNIDGTVAETAEVQHAKAVHFAAHHEALSRGKRWAPLNPDGTVADTPEVAAAKAAHFAEISRARGIAYGPIVAAPVYAGKWWGPAAPLNADGTVAETAEVRAAKAVHFAALAGARLGLPVHPHVHPFHGYAPLNADGTVAETPEVIARKYEHFAAHGEALARTG